MFWGCDMGYIYLKGLEVWRCSLEVGMISIDDSME